VKALVDYIYDSMGIDLDYVIPFAAISEGGREIDSVDDRSELAHRLMLTNVVRLMGAIKARVGRNVWLGLAGLGIDAPRLEAGWLLVGAAFVGVPPWIIFHTSDWAVEVLMHHGMILAIAQAVVLALLTVGWSRVLIATLWGEPSGAVKDGPVPDLGPGEWSFFLLCMAIGAILPFASWWQPMH